MEVIPTAPKTKDKRAHWAEIIAACKKSGQSRLSFCTEKNISISTFGYWQKVLKAHKALFVPVQVKAPQQPEMVFYKIETTLGVNITLSSGAKSEDLKEIFKALGVVA